MTFLILCSLIASVTRLLSLLEMFEIILSYIHTYHIYCNNSNSYLNFTSRDRMDLWMQKIETRSVDQAPRARKQSLLTERHGPFKKSLSMM